MESGAKGRTFQDLPGINQLKGNHYIREIANINCELLDVLLSLAIYYFVGNVEETGQNM